VLAPDTARLLAAEFAGKRLQPEKLEALDTLHVRGRAATLELIQLVRPATGERVLDLGSGFGGPARQIVDSCGCEVVALDLDPEALALGRALDRATGLAGQVHPVAADATRLPFADGAFDVALMVHLAMAVPDKAGLAAELGRVLRRGGRFGFYELVRGHGPEPTYPMPWADRAEASHLPRLEELIAALAAAGFEPLDVRLPLAACRGWALHRARRLEETGDPAPGLRLFRGDNALAAARHLALALFEDRVWPVLGLARRC
jgi:SAM-dependent methyltransferase